MIDFKERLREMRQERYRTLIIYQDGIKQNTELTDFAKRAADKLNYKYFDIAEFINNKPEIARRVDRLNIDDLKKILIENSKNEKVLIVDNLGMIIATWSQRELKEFYQFVRKGWNSYYRTMKATIAFCLPDINDLDNQNIIDSTSNKRIIKLTDIKKIIQE